MKNNISIALGEDVHLQYKFLYEGGEFYDIETGRYYLRSRYYAPSTGRFKQRDSFLGFYSDPLSLNRYTYAHNNPVKYRDPTGYAVTETDKQNLTTAQQAAIQKATDDWNAAKAAGDKAAMQAANDAANAIRASAGYTGGSDGNTISTVTQTKDPGVYVEVLTSTGTQTGYVYQGVTYMEDGSRPPDGAIVTMPSGASYQMDSSAGKGSATTVVAVITNDAQGLTASIAGMANNVVTMLDGSKAVQDAYVFTSGGVICQIGINGTIKSSTNFITVVTMSYETSYGDTSVLGAQINLLSYYDPLMMKNIGLAEDAGTIIAGDMQQFGYSYATAVGAYILMMTADKEGIYHANFDCWQSAFGFNDIFDLVFGAVTSMRNAKFEFSSGGMDYTLWAWKGDYLLLGAGAELGIYSNPKTITLIDEISGQLLSTYPHWKADKSNAMSMTLSVEYTDPMSGLTSSVLNYAPTDPQWWVTGFNPRYQGVDANNLTAVYSVAFNTTTMYNDFYKKYGQGHELDSRWVFSSATNSASLFF